MAHGLQAVYRPIVIVIRPERIFHHFMARWRAGDRSFPEHLDRLCAYVAWTEHGRCIIRNEAAMLVPMRLRLSQRMLLGCMMVQAAAKQPIRIVGLKARKLGFTTCIQTREAFQCMHYNNQFAVLMAHQADSTHEIFDIARLAVEQYPVNAEPANQFLRFPHTRSRYICRTAGGTGAGAGLTPTTLHLSEVALCDRRTKQDLYTSINSVPDHPMTTIVQESTARGRDEFWTLFDEARNDPTHPYIAIFLPWFIDDQLAVRFGNTRFVNLDRNEYERWLCRYAADQYGIELTNEALAWRRKKIKQVSGGLTVFQQEFPATPEEAVVGRRSLVLPNMRETIVHALPFDPSAVDMSQRVGGIDFGYNDPTVIGTGYYIDQVLYVTDVYHCTGELAREHARHVKRGHRYYCDPSALQARHEITASMESGNDAMLIPCPRMIDRRFTSSTNEPEWEAVRTAIEQGKLKILASCADQIVLEADSFEWNPVTGRPNQQRNPGVWWHFDTIDMIRYMYVGCLLSGTVDEVVISR